MAPAENDNKNGNMLLTDKAAITPITPAIGSTSPEACPYKKLFVLDIPSLLNGKDTAAPSGKFCNPIPNAKVIAAINDVPGIPTATPPNATPTANPSGML